MKKNIVIIATIATIVFIVCILLRLGSLSYTISIIAAILSVIAIKILKNNDEIKARNDKLYHAAITKDVTPHMNETPSNDNRNYRQNEDNLRNIKINVSRLNRSDILSLIRKYADEWEYCGGKEFYGSVWSDNLSDYSIAIMIDVIVHCKLDRMASCKRWIRDGVKPDVYFTNYSGLLTVLKELIEFEGIFPFYDPTPTLILHEYTQKQSELTDEFLHRWWDSVLNRAAKLKNSDTRQDKVESLEKELLYYENYLSPENIKTYKKLVSLVIDYENLVKKEKGTIPFDVVGESEVLKELNNAQNPLDKHFALIHAQDFYYKFRDTDEKYLKKCVELCLIDIEQLDKVDKAHIAQQKKMWKGLNVSQKEMHDLETYGFKANIPAWKRLCIIYEKSGQPELALKYCEKAIDYYEKHGCGLTEEFQKRKEKLEAKINKH